MRKIIILLLLCLPPLILNSLGSGVPKWLVVLFVVPFFIYASTFDDSDDEPFGEAGRPIANFLRWGIGLGGVVLGIFLLIFLFALLR